MELTPDEVVAATGAVRRGNHEAQPIRSVSTDSRTLSEGDCFVALRGENFDGHEFLGQAVTRGASALVVERPARQYESLPQFVVPDTLAALGALARAWRMKFPDLPVAAVVGSSGKTTTKEMAAEILGASRRTLSTQGNLNNLIGLPHTLFRLSAEHESAVLELGMNVPDEARRLVEIAQPSLVALTNIRDAHIGMFGSQEALYEGETESLRFAPPGADFIMNADDPLSRRALRECTQGHRVMLFSVEEGTEADYWASEIQPFAPYGYRFRLHEKGNGEGSPVELHTFGRHNVANAVAAAAVARWFGISLSEIAECLTAFRPRLNRSEVEHIHGWWVLKDYYNAVPSAVKAALASLADFSVPGRRFAVLGDMRELGDFEAEAHTQVGEVAAAAGLDRLYTIGDRARLIQKAAAERGAQAEHFEDLDTLAARLASELRSGDLLLIKGSRLMRLERLYAILTGNEAEVGAH